MIEIESITILFSLVALLVSIFGYLDHRRKLKIILEKENERKELKKAIEALKTTSNSLKKLPEYTNFGYGSLMADDILREVYENEKLDLTIELKNLEVSGEDCDRKKYPVESINARLLRNAIKESVKDVSNQDYCLMSCNIDYNARPSIIQNEFYDLGDFFSGLAYLEKNLDKLKEFEPIIDSFDSEILKNIDTNIQDILELLSDALKKKVYNLEFERTMKPTEIQNKIFTITNYTLILEKAKYLGTNVAARVDGLRSKLFELVLTK